jgi:hypothetical protein
VAHQFQWVHLRFAMSQIILTVSGALGMEAERMSFDTVDIQGHAIQFTVACTFVELMLGIQPLIWHTDKTLLRNLARAVATMTFLSGCNILRIEAAQIAYHLGAVWMLAHGIPLGVIYFATWIAVWRTRNWQALHYPASQSVQTPADPLRPTDRPAPSA